MDSKSGALGAERTAGYADEAMTAELVDRVEAQAAELAQVRLEIEELRSERERLKTELVMADGWVRELATALERAEARMAAQDSTLRSRIDSLRAP
jgi:hypothetical protein